MLEVLREDYIRTAKSKGLHERVVLVRHALKNALLPIFGVAGWSLAILLGGSVIIEQIFGDSGRILPAYLRLCKIRSTLPRQPMEFCTDWF